MSILIRLDVDSIQCPICGENGLLRFVMLDKDGAYWLCIKCDLISRHSVWTGTEKMLEEEKRLLKEIDLTKKLLELSKEQIRELEKSIQERIEKGDLE